MKLGVMIEGQEDLTWERWRAVARRTEELGFNSLWRSDHFFSLMGHPERQALETFTSLTITAAETSRIRFGPLVASMTFRHPALLARMAAAIDQLSGGRFVLGVGAGWNVPEHEAFGISFPPLRQRMDMLEEGIKVIRALTSGDRVTVSGTHFHLRNAEMHPTPLQKPLPLLIGGSGERRTLQMVARYADEWNFPGATPERMREKRAVLERHCEREGRDPEMITRSVMSGFVIGENDAAVARRLSAIRGILTSLPAVADGDLMEALTGRGWLIGTPGAVVEQIRALGEAGAQRVMLQHHNHGDFEVLDLIAREIEPALA